MGNFNSGRRPAHEEMRLKKGQFSTRQMSERASVSMRTLDWWTQKGFLDHVHKNEGEGKGSRRVWNADAWREIKDVARRIRDCPYDHNAS